jgi:hypothetical protein
MGVAGAALSHTTILLTGLAGMVADAISMARGEWLSVQSSRESYARQVAIERDELESAPEEELEELALAVALSGALAALALFARGAIGSLFTGQPMVRTGLRHVTFGLTAPTIGIERVHEAINQSTADRALTAHVPDRGELARPATRGPCGYDRPDRGSGALTSASVGHTPAAPRRQTFSTSASNSVNDAFASPNNIDVFGLQNSLFSIPENPGFMLRFNTTTLRAWSTFRIGMP